MPQFNLKSPKIKLGIVPTHIKFVGGLLPEENGDLPRDASGTIKVVANMKKLIAESPAPINVVQLAQFAGVQESVTAELVQGLRALDLEVQFVMMIGSGDPMNPADENLIVQRLVEGLRSAQSQNVSRIASVSMEAWMQGGAPKTGADFDDAVAQLVKLHLRAYQEAEVEKSCIQAWDLEFLRAGEFQTFTNLGKAWLFIKAANEALGKPFFKILVDTAHCGDSDLSIPENQALIAEIADAGAMGVFHCSAKTTRGCFSTDDGWIGSLLAAAAASGSLEYVFVEYFHHEDEGLEALRDFDPIHGIDTTDGRTYDAMVVDGLVETTHRLNNLYNRGILK